MPTLKALTTEELIESFTRIDDWEARFTYLLDLADQVPPMDEANLVDDNRIRGCVSEVWLKSRITDDEPRRLEFLAKSDAQLVTGLIAILMVIYNGRTLHDAVKIDAADVLKQMDLDANLSPTRRNGLHAMVHRIRALARQALEEAD
jgi:cysteine desulfuration protein SufE